MPHPAVETNTFRFAASSIERAQGIILTPTRGLSTQERWKRETEATAGFLAHVIPMNANAFDFGCGIGRVSKALLAKRPDLTIVGVETSPDMRALAESFVGDRERFKIANSLRDFDPGQFSFGFAIYALQHVSGGRLKYDLGNINEKISKDGAFYLLDAKRRYVPVKTTIERLALLQRPANLDLTVDLIAKEIFPREHRWQWSDDGVRIPERLRRMFRHETPVPLPPDAFAPEIISGHHSILFERT